MRTDPNVFRVVFAVVGVVAARDPEIPAFVVMRARRADVGGDLSHGHAALNARKVHRFEVGGKTSAVLGRLEGARRHLHFRDGFLACGDEPKSKRRIAVFGLSADPAAAVVFRVNARLHNGGDVADARLLEHHHGVAEQHGSGGRHGIGAAGVQQRARIAERFIRSRGWRGKAREHRGRQGKCCCNAHQFVKSVSR